MELFIFGFELIEYGTNETMEFMMKKLIYLVAIAVVMMLSACENKEATPEGDAGMAMDPNVHAVSVVEVIQVPDYSYLEVEEKGERYW
ncbi:MAG: hypothetical protein KDI38_21315, partial [Calditrichaeota bacterium]|nr:hypothetical protein [Calditrichota bacterium]